MWVQHKTADPEVDSNANRAGAEHGSAPSWTKHETARLCHVTGDARY